MDRVHKGGPWTGSTGVVHGPGVHILYTSLFNTLEIHLLFVFYFPGRKTKLSFECKIRYSKHFFIALYPYTKNIYTPRVKDN